MARTFPILAAAAVALTSATAAVAAPERSTANQQTAHSQRFAAAKQPVVPGFYEGKTVRYFNFGPIKLRPGNKLAPIWTFTNGAAGQHNIIDTVPGQRALQRTFCGPKS